MANDLATEEYSAGKLRIMWMLLRTKHPLQVSTVAMLIVIHLICQWLNVVADRRLWVIKQLEGSERRVTNGVKVHHQP